MLIDDNYASDQDAQIHVSIIGNYFGIILEVTGQDRGIVSKNQQQQPTLFICQNVSSPLCSYMIIVLHIKMLKFMCLSLVITLVLSSKLQVDTEELSATTNSNNHNFPVI